ncbi:ester cyclase, partial [Terriglobus sp. YAF25]
MKLYSALFLGMVFVRGLAVEHQGDKRSLPTQRNAPREVVEQFINIVRSGRDPAKASEFFAPLVQAHQLTSEGETTIVRTPEDYAAHVQEFLRTYGTYKLTIAELVSDGDRVYVRWKQEGRHLAPIHGFQPTGLPLVEV